MTKNKKAYTRKQKHKVSLAEEDVVDIVEECVKKIIKGGR